VFCHVSALRDSSSKGKVIADAAIQNVDPATAQRVTIAFHANMFAMVVSVSLPVHPENTLTSMENANFAAEIVTLGGVAGQEILLVPEGAIDVNTALKREVERLSAFLISLRPKDVETMVTTVITMQICLKANFNNWWSIRFVAVAMKSVSAAPPLGVTQMFTDAAAGITWMRPVTHACAPVTRTPSCNLLVGQDKVRVGIAQMRPSVCRVIRSVPAVWDLARKTARSAEM
jgi:hypothetical protein